jgi:hypothetical protein
VKFGRDSYNETNPDFHDCYQPLTDTRINILIGLPLSDGLAAAESVTG